MCCAGWCLPPGAQVCPYHLTRRRWLAPRADAVEELSLALQMQLLSANQLVPAVVVPPCGLPALRQLTIEWPGTAMWTTAAQPWQQLLPALNKLDFVLGTQLCLENRGLCVLPSLREFSMANGTLELSACLSPWLPPTLTSLWLSAAGIRGIPSTVTHLTSLRRRAQLTWSRAVCWVLHASRPERCCVHLHLIFN